MDSPGKKFLSGSRLAGDQNVGLAAAGLGQKIKARFKKGAVSDDLLPVEGQVPY